MNRLLSKKGSALGILRASVICLSKGKQFNFHLCLGRKSKERLKLNLNLSQVVTFIRTVLFIFSLIIIFVIISL